MGEREVLLALADRCQAATGPDREIDFAIFRALHPEYAGPEWQEFAGGLRHRNDSSDMRCLPPPSLTPARWTASLDAALTLVPDGHALSLHVDADGTVHAGVMLDDGDGCDNAGRCGKTPSLAIVTAALRARAAEAADE